MQLNKLAFTLIELLVVIAVIGILSGLIVISMSGTTEKATIAKAQVFSSSLRNSLMSNIVSEWRFDGAGVSDGGAAISDYVKDSWNGTNNGTVNSGPLVYSGTSCIFGSCLYLDGIDDYISTGHNGIDNITNMVTIEAWFKSSTYTVYSDVYQDNHVITYVTNSGNGLPDGLNMMHLGFYQNNFRARYFGSTWTNGFAYTQPISMDKWHYAAISLNFPNLNFYIDGSLISSVTVGSALAISTSTKNINIGRWNTGTTYFKGFIDNVRIYDSAVSNTEIKEQYYAGLNSLLLNGGITKEEYLSRMIDVALD